MFDIIDLGVAAGVGGCIGAVIALLGMRGKLVENAGVLEDCEEHNRELIKAVEAHKSDAQIFAKAQRAWRAFFEVVSERDAARARLVTASATIHTLQKNDARDPRTGRYVKTVEAVL